MSRATPGFVIFDMNDSNVEGALKAGMRGHHFTP
jgi:hypothetical protein